MSPPPTEPTHPTEPTWSPRPVLHAETTGHGPRIVAAHGFTQTGRVWGSLATDLATDHQVVLVDMPGHGRSSHVAADLVLGAQLLGDVGGRAAYLGYSMGARFCLHLALARPDLVESLVLISGTAGIEHGDERASRRAADEELATELDAVDDPRSPHTAGPPDLPDRLDAFLRRWLDAPLFAGIPPEAGGLAERRRNTGAGLASSLRLAGTGVQLPLWSQLHQLAMPVLVITGSLDDKFTGLGATMAASIGPRATHVVVAGAGHAPHLQRPGAVAEAVRAHLA